ncbi:MAG TPA: YciI family protein [Gemmatimonadaceae bacterium]|nr:YciI family protein [Gemmatimonadaceae bacterium]
MSDFIYLFRTTPEARRAAMGTPEQAQQSMQRWLAWMRDIEAKGHLKNRGQPLEDGGKTVRGPKKLVTDGPFPEVKDLVAGFMIVQAADIAQAAELAKGCPILERDGAVEVRPVMTMDY